MAEAPNSSDGPAARSVVYNLDEKRRERSAASDAAVPPDPGKEAEAAGPLPPTRGSPDSSREARAEKIADLKARIASGQYKPDPEEIAREMLKRGF